MSAAQSYNLRHLIIMLFGKRFSLGLTSLMSFLYTVALKSARTGVFHLDNQCEQLSEHGWTRLSQIPRISSLDCARRCLQHDDDCQLVRASYNNKNKGLWCELFTANASAMFPESFPMSLNSLHADCYRLHNTVDDDETTYICSQACIFPFCDKRHDTELTKSDWIDVVDTDQPNTLTLEYMENLSAPEETKSILYMPDGIVHAIVNNFYTIVSSRWYVAMTYTMEESYDGFQQDGSRIIYNCKYQGTCYRITMTGFQGGSTKYQTSRLRIVRQKENEYSLQLENEQTNVATLISWLEQGYKLANYNYAKVWNMSAISMYRINDNMRRSGSKLTVPLAFTQEIHVFPKYRYFTDNALGVPNIFVNKEEFNATSVSLSPLWLLADNTFDSFSEYIFILSSYLCYGHKFRVGFNRSFFDVDNVFRMGDEMFFILSQQVNTSGTERIASDTTGTRAVLSASGSLSWCSHKLEGNSGIGTGYETGILVSVFIDKKEWNAALSVFSNGTIVFGSSSDLADAVLEGKDVGVLMNMLVPGVTRRLTLTMMTVINYGHPNVLISGQSKPSWVLSMSMEIDPKCEMERVLVKSNGYVELLVYTPNFRQVPTTLDDILITWFIY